MQEYARRFSESEGCALFACAEEGEAVLNSLPLLDVQPESAELYGGMPPVGQVWSPWSQRVLLTRELTELILKSRRVVPGRLPAAGFAFRFTDWETAAGDLVTRWRARG